MADDVKFLLSGENPALSKFEVESLFGVRARRRGRFCYFSANLSEEEVRRICERSAMIKRAWMNGQEVWRAEKGRFSEREPKKKPAFHPAMLKPKLARLLVNLSGVRSGGVLLDPFCGTGSILIEASVLGVWAVGMDIKKKAIWQSKQNLAHYGLQAGLVLGDATKLENYFKPASFDGIATDPPYGRASTLAGKKLREVYEEFLLSASKVLKPSRRLVMMYPKGFRFKIPQVFVRLGAFDWYVHKSLTRRILVLEHTSTL